MSIELPAAGGRDRLEIVVNYTAVFNQQPPALPIHNEDPTYGISATISPNGTFLSAASGWYPLLPGGPARYRVRIEAPPGYVGVISGRLLESGETLSTAFSQWETENPLQPLSLAAGPYLVKKDLAGTIPIYAYFYPQSQDLAEIYLQATRRYLDLYQGLFGPYPFEKFAVAENFFPTGYGFPSWSLLGSSVVRLPFIVETSLGHEIAHSWWGTGVAVDASRGNWAEGLTTYLADHLYKEQASATDGAEYRQNILRDYATLVSTDNDFALARFVSRNSKSSQAVGYGKGAMLFHMLRKQIGETAFWDGLRKVAAEKMFSHASWSDFRQAFESTSGAPLAAFFSQWVERSGAPTLELRDVSSVRTDGQWLVSGTLLQRGETYDLAVPLRLEGEAAVSDQFIDSAEAETPFAITLSWPPTRLRLDPDIDLFRRLAVEEIPPTVNGIRGSGKLLVIVADSLEEPIRKAALTLVAALRQERALVVHESAVSEEQLRDHDLLFIGLPSRSAIRPALPDGLMIGDRTFEVAGNDFTRSAADLFAALPHPRQKQKNCALFISGSADSAKIAGRKIPHYGKYSYLVFEQGSNRIKGTWTSPGSKTIHEFPPESRHE
ncbi:M1 family metallopeptidase [Trichloromonas sp.]|uniref:M1 family metallopeptidase n=1 Tax=Trichloromonas sp. TaxID=3069249 RepID=UPI003D817A80